MSARNTGRQKWRYYEMKKQVVSILLALAMSNNLVMPAFAETADVATQQMAVTGTEAVQGTVNNEIVETIDEVADTENSCGEDAVWAVKDGVLTISGTGSMADYSSEKEQPWNDERSAITSVVVSDGIISVGDFAFYGMENLESVTLPDSVTVMGKYVFKNCVKLKNITLPAGLTAIGESAFNGNSSLEQITIPDGVQKLPGYIFKNCSLLKSVELPEKMSRIGESAFFGCSSLEKITIPEGVYTIWSYTFKGCTSLKDVSLPSTLIKLDEAAFYGCKSLASIEIPSNVAIIGVYCFKNCSSLVQIKLPEKLTEIREAAFYATAIPSIEIPEGVTSIGPYAFKNCTALKDIVLPDTLTSVGESSFYGCVALNSITLPKNVTSIEGYAFKNCTGLKEIGLPDSLKSIGDSAFYGCTSLKKIDIPKNVSAVGDYAFARCSNLHEVTFNGNAPTIYANSFSKVTATIIYPTNRTGWWIKGNKYGGTLTWEGRVVDINPGRVNVPQMGRMVQLIDDDEIAAYDLYEDEACTKLIEHVDCDDTTNMQKNIKNVMFPEAYASQTLYYVITDKLGFKTVHAVTDPLSISRATVSVNNGVITIYDPNNIDMYFVYADENCKTKIISMSCGKPDSRCLLEFPNGYSKVWIEVVSVTGAKKVLCVTNDVSGDSDNSDESEDRKTSVVYEDGKISISDPDAINIYSIYADEDRRILISNGIGYNMYIGARIDYPSGYDMVWVSVIDGKGNKTVTKLRPDHLGSYQITSMGKGYVRIGLFDKDGIASYALYTDSSRTTLISESTVENAPERYVVSYPEEYNSVYVVFTDVNGNSTEFEAENPYKNTSDGDTGNTGGNTGGDTENIGGSVPS